MSDTGLFRADARKRLDHPDQLASGLRLVNPGFGLAVTTLAALVVAALASAVFVEVPVTVAGSGVILSSKGVLEFTVTSDHEGRVADILVDVGDSVRPGQEIARIELPTLETERRLARRELDQIMADETRLRELQAQSTAMFEGLRQRQEDTIKETIGYLDARRQVLTQLAAGMEVLRQSGNATADRYLTVQAELAEVLERTADKESDLLSLALSSNERQAQFERELQSILTRKSQVQVQIDRLDDRIAGDSSVRSTQHGVVSELKVFPGDLVRFDTPLVSILPGDESFAALRPGSSYLVASVMVPARDGKKIDVGMKVLLDPTSVRRDVYGSVEGTVTRISDVAASPEQLRHMLRNDNLVQKLSASGPPFLITVEMTPDRGTPTGLSWTTSEGPDTRITAGTLLDANIVTEHVPVIGLLTPALKELLRWPQQRQ